MALKIILFIVLVLATLGTGIWICDSFANDRKVQGITSVVLSIALLLVLIIVPGSIHQVKTGEVAVVRRFGVIEDSKAPGLYYQNWFARNYEYYDTKVQQVTITTPAYSSDGQTLDIEVVIQYRIRQDEVIKIATYYGDLEKLESRIETVSIERLKSVISEKSAMGIIATRNVVSADVTARIEEAIGADYYVDITNVVLTNIDFTDEFEKIVEDKVAAEQEAQKAVNEAAKKETEAQAAKKVAELQADAELYKSQKEAEALLVKAQAEADALKLEKKATSDAIQQYIDSLGLSAEEAVKLYEYIIWIQAWDGDVPTVTDSASGYIVVPQQ